MKNFLKQNYLFIILLIASFILHFAFLSYPAQVVFDEVHFGKFATAYSTREYYFDIHPPLGKLIIAGWAKIANINQSFDFDHIGETADPKLFFALRFLPAFFGSIFVLLFSYFGYLVSRSKKTALVAGFLLLLDNGFLAQSKFIFIDIFLLFFEISAFCFFFLYQRQKSFGLKWLVLLILAGVSFGLAISIKWTGLAAIGVIGAALFAKIFSPAFAAWLTLSAAPAQKNNYLKYAKEAIISLAIIIFAGFAVYTIPFAVHFNILTKPGTGGAFMSEKFQSELARGKENTANPLNFWQKINELNITMFKANAGITKEHPFGSKWYKWPFDKKPIYYWNQDKFENDPGKSAKIYFAGNPVLWWLALAAIGLTLARIASKKERQKINPALYILTFGYFAGLLPYIAITRVSFLYHYLPSVIFAIMALAIYLEKVWEKDREIFIALAAAAAISFIALAPLTYGWPMAPDINQFEMKIIDLLS